ncbi:amidohydrolase family protein [Bradyrhizobium diazoefficiens]|nr:amidohydrolase family protein [Bradyrhizobium diazoefficiens]MBR0775161.1 amidohydrolase family protein [Bradyrhizobium diazoefficiens]
MFDGRKNRYGRTAARKHRALGRARKPSTTTIDIHCHIVVPAGAQVAGPHVDRTKLPLVHFASAASREINAAQEKDRARVMVDIDARLFDMEAMGIDIQLVAPAPGQCYYSIDAEIGARAHSAVNEGVAEFVARRPDRFMGLGVTTMQAPDLAVSELETAVTKLGLKGVQILTNVNGEELSDPKFRPFFARAEQLGAFIMLHPNGFTDGRRFSDYYFNNVIGNPLETTLALHQLIFGGTLARFPELKILAVHGGGYLPGYSGRIDHAWGARADSHADLPLPPSSYLRQVYFDTVVFTEHQLAYLIDVFGADHILMGTDYPFDMAEYDPIGHVAALDLDERTFAAVCGGNAALALGLRP